MGVKLFVRKVASQCNLAAVKGLPSVPFVYWKIDAYEVSVGNPSSGGIKRNENGFSALPTGGLLPM